MRFFVRVAAVMTATAFVAGLAACTPDEAPPGASAGSPSPTATPIFATETDALEAVMVAYTRYLKVSDEITAEGGKNAQRIATLVLPSYQETVLESFAPYRDAKIHTSGKTTFSRMRIQSLPNSGIDQAVVAYVCTDVSGVHVKDAKGRDITPADRQDVLPLELGYRVEPGAEKSLLLERSEVWSGNNYCAS